MWNSRVEFLEKTHYHVANTSHKREKLFLDREDFEKFYTIVVKYQKQYSTLKLVSFCFLPDHFHFVIHNYHNWYDLSDFMRKIQLSYSMYYKKKYAEKIALSVGFSLFAWRFTSYLIPQKDDMLNKVLAFVNFNALKHSYVQDIKDYPYTSYHQILKTGPKKFFRYKDYNMKELEN